MKKTLKPGLAHRFTYQVPQTHLYKAQDISVSA
jgi:hypothetical protein